MDKKVSKSASSLYGKNSVLERLRHDPRTINEISVTENFDNEEALRLISENRISCRTVPQKEFSKMRFALDAQGVIAKIRPFEYVDFDAIVAAVPKKVIIFLDHLFDPQNLGVIIRTAACFGNFALVIPKHEACEVTESVLHVACGGENFISVARVTNLTQALETAKKEGYWIVGTIVEGGESLHDCKLPYPLGIVMGSEGKGIRQGLRGHIDKAVYIPMSGAKLSLNVASATAVICYEAQKQAEK
jgi:23S rRNA (guanosine2251-2'-O)-methyltransferase